MYFAYFNFFLLQIMRGNDNRILTKIAFWKIYVIC